MPSTLPFRFLHTGDLHLDSPVIGLRGEATPEIMALLRDATSRAWRNVVALAIAERVDFVVVAGDVFERSSPTLLGQTRFRDGLVRAGGARDRQLSSCTATTTRWTASRGRHR